MESFAILIRMPRAPVLRSSGTAEGGGARGGFTMTWPSWTCPGFPFHNQEIYGIELLQHRGTGHCSLVGAHDENVLV